jgi:hypothetical protein
MAMKSLGFAGIVIAVLTVACGGDMPLAPGRLNNDRAAVLETPMNTESPASPPTLTTQYISDATITLQPDGTASPAVVSVAVDHTILMVNKSSKYVRVRSSNCGEFATMGLQPGGSSHTMPFRPAGKTCEYHVSAYPNMIYQGQVNVD